MFSFLDTAASITKFELRMCRMEQNGAAGARILAEALASNTNIEDLSLLNLEDACLLPILQGLVANSTLRKLTYAPYFRREGTRGPLVEASLAIQRVLESSTTCIRAFTLTGCQDFYPPPKIPGAELRPITQALIQSPTVTDIRISHCRVFEAEAKRLVGSIAQTKPNLSSLALHSCEFRSQPGFQDEYLYEPLNRSLVRSDSSLRYLEFVSTFLPYELPNERFGALMAAVTKSKLEHLCVGRLQTRQELQALIDCIPAMKLEKLTIETHLINYWAREVMVEMKPSLMHALQRNYSLRRAEVTCNYLSNFEWFDDDQKTKLIFYSERNQSLGEWVENPSTVGRRVWPEALTHAQLAGPDTLFKSLLALSGSGVGLRQSNRKRKQPHDYQPS